ncbi:hypothetical protein [uncultured Campylobacter sp.]|nr:hypothetical protein [uncultured Campylobacter sp.]
MNKFEISPIYLVNLSSKFSPCCIKFKSPCKFREFRLKHLTSKGSLDNA